MRPSYLPVQLTVAVSAMTLLATACGGDDGDSKGATPSSSADVVVTATDLKFDSKNYTATEGNVTFEYLQKGSQPHTLRIEDKSTFKLSVNGSKSDRGEMLLKAGTYTLYCDIPGHRLAGMEATLTVE